MFRHVLVFLLLVSAISGAPTAWAQSYDLTGYWLENDFGVTYQFRQVDDRIFWYMDSRPRVVNVFYGTIAGDMITGRWADLPGGNLQGQGTIGLRIESNDRIVKISQTGSRRHRSRHPPRTAHAGR